MKIVLSILFLGGLISAAPATNAAPAKKAARHAVRKGAKTARAAKTAKAQKPAGELKTDVSFDDSVLHGQYQTPDEALARVENEKGFGDLVGVRKHFKDRMRQAADQE